MLCSLRSIITCKVVEALPRTTMRLLLILLALLVGGAAWAQHMQPYAGQQKREIKALSEEDVAGYLGGAGMGYAKAAELNGYPGPMHVLELGDRLELTDEQ